MKKIIVYAALIATVLGGLTACGKSDEEKTKEEIKKIYNAPIERKGY